MLVKTRLLFFFIFLISIAVHAQFILKSNGIEPLSFKEMQLQFDKWKATTDLKKQHGWKSFKRWEAETSYHTDAHGNPVNPATYINEVTRLAKLRENSANSRKLSTNSWLPSGPFTLPLNLTQYMEAGMGRINCIAFHPNDPNTYFVGVAQGGLWKTSNNGQSWTPLTDNLPILRISDILIDPNNTNVMYISVCDFEYIDVSLKLDGRKRNTHYGLGLYKTTDGGLTWQPTGLSFQLTNGDASLIRKTFILPTNSNRLVACGTSGMYISNDAGINWTKTMDSLFWDMVQDPQNPNVLYAASGWLAFANTGNSAIYKSTDFGLNWTMLTTSIPATGAVTRIKLAIAPSDNNYIYAATVNTSKGLYGFYKSTDAGTSWQFIPPAVNVLDGGDGTGTGGQGTYDLGLTVSATDRDVVYTGGVNMWGSADGAQTFNPIGFWTTLYGPSIHADIHAIEKQSLTGDVFVCSDGGLYRTHNVLIHSWIDANNGINWPTVWDKLNDGLQITSFYRLSSSKNASAKLLAGAQDNSSFYFNGASWANIFGGDGMDNYINPLNDSNLIGSSQYGSFYRSDNNGLPYSGTYPNVNGEVADWTSPIIADYNQNGTLYAGFGNVTQSTDGGISWNVISNFPIPGATDNEIVALAVANTNSSVLYAAKRVRYEYAVPGYLYNSLDGGANWNDVTMGLPDSLFFTSVTINDTNSSVAYITLAGFEAGVKIFKTENSGASWQNISYNLPNLPVNCVKSLPGGKKLVVATDIGMYLLDDTSSVWQDVSTGLPNVILTDIEINEPLNKLYVSTFGRGIWETDLDQILTVPKQTTANSGFQLYPSLNKGNFTIQLSTASPLAAPAKLQIIDIMGRIVLNRELFTAENNIQLQVSSGKYFAKVIEKSGVSVKSFNVE